MPIQVDGSLQLGDEARELGYHPGKVVQVVVLSTGSLLLVMDDAPEIDVPYKPLPSQRVRPALKGRTV